MDHRRIGPYRVLSVLGAGGMGVVYRAVQPQTGQEVAVKVARVRPRSRRALQLEIQALSRLRHPGIVQILEHGEQGGEAWIATELVRGRPLRDQLAETHPSSGSGAPSTLSMDDLPEDASGTERVRWERGPLQATLTLFRRLCVPLGYLHGEGLVHGDLKPENVLVREDGSVVLVDFGLFRSFGATGRDVLQVQQQVMGTVGYLSPEQRQIRTPDARSDLYAVGCMLYEALTGRRPLGRAIHQRPTPVQPPSELADIPAELDALVLSLLEWEPRRRLAYASDLGEALERLGAEPVQDPPPRISLVRPSLVGRQRELQDAREAHAVVVVGEAGTGKTRLLAELGEARDTLALGADSRSEGGVVPALLRALAQSCPGEQTASDWFGMGGPVLVALEPSLRAWPALAESDPPEPLPPGASLTRAAASVVRAFVAAAPLRVLVDDLDRADELAQRVMTSLARRKGHGVRLAASCAPESPVAQQLVDAGAVRVRLDPLPEPLVSALLAEQLGTDLVPPELDAFVRGHAGGNPRFATEYLRLLAFEGHLARRRGQWVVLARSGLASLPVPSGVEDMALRRLAALSAPARSAASRATVLDPGQLPADLLSELVSAQILEVAQDQPRWALPALEQVVYASLSSGERTALHRAALELLAPDAPAAVRARHLERAGRPEEAREAWLRAGLEADQASRWVEGVSHLQSALVGTPPPEQELEARLRLSRMWRLRGKLAEALAETDRVLAHSACTASQRRLALLSRAKALSRQGAHAEAVEILREMASEGAEQVLEALAEALGEAGDLEGSVESRRQALAFWQDQGNEAEQAEARVNLANVLQRQGRLAEADALLEQAIPVLRAQRRALAAANASATLALVRASQGDWPGAEGAARDARDAFVRLGVLTTEAQVRLVLAEALRHQGQREAALQELVAAQALAAELAIPRLEAMVDYNFALTEVYFGGSDSVPVIERSVATCRAAGLTGPEADLLLRLARVRREAGQWALVSLDRAEQLAEQRQDLGLQLRVCCERGLVLHHEGGDARPLLERAEALVCAMGGTASADSLRSLRSALNPTND